MPTGIFLSYDRGVGPKGLPPPFHWVARIEPWRARPVPFWRHGFLPPPDTSLRPRVSWVPTRRSASSRVTAWCRRGTRTATPNTADFSSRVPASLPCASSTLTVGMALFLLHGLLLLGLGRLHALAHHHQTAVGPGHGAPEQDEVLLGHHPDHAQVQHGALDTSHASGQPVARPHSRRIRGGADRAGGPVEHRAVGVVAAIPSVTLDPALEALALRHADHVDQLARGEHLHRERLTDLVALELLRLLQPDLAQ